MERERIVYRKKIRERQGLISPNSHKIVYTSGQFL